MRRISDLAADGQALKLRWQDIEHSDSRDEGGGTQGNFELIRRAIVIPNGLMVASRYLHRVKGSDLGRRESVQSGVDMPSIQAGVTFGGVLWGNLGLVETRVLRVFQLGFTKTFVIVNGTISDELNLRNSRDCLEVRVKNRLAVLLGLVITVAVGITLRIESLEEGGVVAIIRSVDLHLTYLRKFVLLLRREINVPEEESVMLDGRLISKEMTRTLGDNTSLVKQLLDLLELLVRQPSRVDTFDLPTKVLELGRVGSGWEGKRKGFDGHCKVVGDDILGRKGDKGLVCATSSAPSPPSASAAPVYLDPIPHQSPP